MLEQRQGPRLGGDVLEDRVDQARSRTPARRHGLAPRSPPAGRLVDGTDQVLVRGPGAPQARGRRAAHIEVGAHGQDTTAAAARDRGRVHEVGDELRALASSWQSVNSSSAWSTTQTSRLARGVPGEDERAQGGASVRRAPARRGSAASTRARSSSWSRAASASSRPTARAHDLDRPAVAPREGATRSAGTRPARTSDDLPLPDGPRTARKRLAFSCSRMAWTSPSRPKKRSACASSNVWRPRYGQASSRGDERDCRSKGDALDRVDERLHRPGVIEAAAKVDPRPCRQEGRKRGPVERLGNSGSRTGKSRNGRSFAARLSATASSSRSQSPSPFGPTK